MHVSRRMIAVVLAMGLLGGAMTMPADAAKKKKKKKPKPVATVLYMHGEQNFGEIDGALWLAGGSPPESPMTIDGAEPEGSSAKSQAIGSPAFNSECTGLPSGFPTFTGAFEGTITGDIKLIANFDGAAAAVARIWADVGAFQACNDDYIQPNAEVEFEAESGEVEIVFEGVNIPATSSLMVEILRPEVPAAPMPRLQYDAESAATRLEFGCFPPKGAKTCVPEAEAEE